MKIDKQIIRDYIQANPSLTNKEVGEYTVVKTIEELL